MWSSLSFCHLLTLSPKFQALAEKFPLPKRQTRTTTINKEVENREKLLTAVGLPNNTFNIGSYDYRQQNKDLKIQIGNLPIS